MVRYKSFKPNRLVITYDDAKTSVEKIIQSIGKGGMKVEGNPVPLEAEPKQ